MRLLPTVAGLLLALAALLALCAPAALAQTPAGGYDVAVSVRPHGDPIPPVTDVGMATANVTLTCRPGTLDPTPVTVSHVAGPGNASDNFTIATVDNATRTVSFTPDDCALGRSRSYEMGVHVKFSGLAPGMKAVGLTFTASVEGGDPATANWKETPGVFMKFDARLDQAIFKVGPDDPFHLPLFVRNEGNVPVLVAIDVAPPPAGVRLDATLPDTILVQPWPTVSPHRDVGINIAVRAPDVTGYANDIRTVKLHVNATPEPDGPGGRLSQKTLTFQVHTEGFGAGGDVALPLPAVAALLALVAAAFARRWRS